MTPLRGKGSLSSDVMQRDDAARTPDDGRGPPRGFEHAACQPYPTPWWFADGPDDVEATLICMSCPVRRACLDYALEHPELVGVRHDRRR